MEQLSTTDVLYQLRTALSNATLLADDMCRRVAARARGTPWMEREPLSLGEVAKLLYEERRRRDRHFPGDYFSDAAWDIFLDLYIAEREERPVSVSSLCIAACVPPTTGLRWIKLLTDEGRLVRIADPNDGRRVYVRLSPEMSESLTLYLTSVRQDRHLAKG